MADSMDKKYSNVPNLRFSNESWNMVQIKELCSVVSGGTPSTEESSFWNGNIQWFTPTEVGNYKYVTFSKRTITELGLKKSSAKLLPAGSILLSTRATVGEASICTKECTTNQGFQSLIPNNKCNNEFLYYLVQTKKKEMVKRSCGSTFNEISNSQVGSIKVRIPSIEQQKKISKFLSYIDERIDTQNKIISAKKSLMKNIVVGMKNDSASSVALSSIAEIYQPQTLAQNELIPGDYYVYGANGIIGKHNRYNHENEEICLTCRGSTCGNLCLSKPFSWINGNAMVIKTNNNINKHFIYYALLKINWSKYISGSGQPQIVRSAIQNIRINLPDIEIQNKISIVLDTLNDSIEAELLLLNKLNELKRYLLSNLFI